MENALAYNVVAKTTANPTMSAFTSWSYIPTTLRAVFKRIFAPTGKVGA
jgi:hypothetical protein